MYPPLKGKVILGFDPGFRTGCKYALVDEFGRMKLVGQVFITAASEDKVKMGVYEIAKILANNKELNLLESDLQKILKPEVYIGRSIEQVEKYLEKIKPIINNVSLEKIDIDL